MSNRFAWSWKLTALGIPVVLVYLGFLDALDMTDKGRPFANPGDWERAVKDHSNPLFPPEVWGRRWCCEGQPFVPLIRAINQPLRAQSKEMQNSPPKEWGQCWTSKGHLFTPPIKANKQQIRVEAQKMKEVQGQTDEQLLDRDYTEGQWENAPVDQRWWSIQPFLAQASSTGCTIRQVCSTISARMITSLS